MKTAATLILLLMANGAYAADTRYVWTNPSFQAKADSCAEKDTIPETSLSHARMTLIRVDDPDTLDLGDKPLTGPGVADSVAISTVDSVWLHIFSLRNFDRAGNGACLPVSYLQVTPVTEWPPTVPPPNPGISARYFDNPDFTGVTADVIDPMIDFSSFVGWATHGTGPGIFSVRWVGFITIPTTGPCTFCVDSDDGARLWVDGRVLVDRWTSGPLKACGSSGFSAGLYPIQLDYFQNGGTAIAKLLWSHTGQAETVVPASALSH